MGAIKTQRQTLVAGVQTAIFPPIDAHKVTVGNATQDDVRLEGDTQSAGNYIVIAAGFEREVAGPQNGQAIFSRFQTAFFLTSIAGGTVVLEWL